MNHAKMGYCVQNCILLLYYTFTILYTLFGEPLGENLSLQPGYFEMPEY